MNPLDGCQTVAEAELLRMLYGWKKKKYQWLISMAFMDKTLKTVLTERSVAE